jgi:hypothetical protein
MRTILAGTLLALLFALAGCNVAKDTADTTEKGGQGAVGLAEKMSGGTVGDADADSGESSSSTDSPAAAGE